MVFGTRSLKYGIESWGSCVDLDAALLSARNVPVPQLKRAELRNTNRGIVRVGGREGNGGRGREIETQREREREGETERMRRGERASEQRHMRTGRNRDRERPKTRREGGRYALATAMLNLDKVP